MAWGPKAPGIVEALVQLFTVAMAGVAEDGSDVRVWDGPTPGTPPLELLTVGWTGVEGVEDITEELNPEGLGGDRTLVTISCAACVVRGSTDMAAARRQATKLLAACGAAVAADPKLANTVMRARVASITTAQDQTTRGAQVTSVFTVECDAFTTR